MSAFDFDCGGNGSVGGGFIMSKRIYTQVGEVRSASSVSGSHIIKEDEHGNLSCDCMSWRFQHRPLEERTCRHTEEFIRRLGVRQSKDEIIFV